MTLLVVPDRDTERLSDLANLDGGTDPATTGRWPVQDFIDALLAALTQMAALSPRRQADVGVAMRRAGLAASPETVQASLDQLRRDGSVEKPLVLSDGGVLVSVTARGIEQLANTAHRHIVAAMMAPRLG